MNINLDIPSIISAVAVILTAWWKYNQYRHDKLTDMKIDNMKQREKHRTSQLSYNSGKVFGELWNILHQAEAGRDAWMYARLFHLEHKLNELRKAQLDTIIEEFDLKTYGLLTKGCCCSSGPFYTAS